VRSGTENLLGDTLENVSLTNGVIMHYLAMLGTSFDDIPLKLFTNRNEAEEFVRNHPPEAPESILNLTVRYRAEPFCFYIATFSDDGELIAFDVARCLDEEEAPAESC